MCKHNTYSYLWLNGELQAVDKCIVLLILQLNLAVIKTVGCCCGHSKRYPNVTCVPGTEEKLRGFGCKIVITRQDGKAEACLPVNSFSGKVFVEK